MGIDAKEKVLELIDQRKGSIIEILQKLVSFPSVTGDEWDIQSDHHGLVRLRTVNESQMYEYTDIRIKGDGYGEP